MAEYRADGLVFVGSASPEQCLEAQVVGFEGFGIMGGKKLAVECLLDINYRRVLLLLSPGRIIIVDVRGLGAVFVFTVEHSTNIKGVCLETEFA